MERPHRRHHKTFRLVINKFNSNRTKKTLIQKMNFVEDVQFELIMAKFIWLQLFLTVNRPVNVDFGSV